MVSGLPSDATEESITIYFQREKHGGGDVDDVKILESGKALVVFENSKGLINLLTVLISILFFSGKLYQRDDIIVM